MTKLKAFFLVLPFLFATFFFGSTTATAAQVGPPSSGDHVHYYDCKGPYYGTAYRLIYDCYADWDWFAEVFWGRKDGRIYVNAIYYA